MRRAFPILLLAMIPVALAAHDLRFYIGTYTGQGKSRGIYTATLDSGTGKLGAVELAGEAPNPSFLALTPDGGHLYAALEDRGGAVGAFAVEKTGLLAHLNTQPSGGAGTCHVSVDGTGRNVFVANYGDGSVASFHTTSDGSLESHASLIKFIGSGPDPDRQKKPYAHSIQADPSNRFVYACDLGTDSVWIFHLDAATGTLTASEPAAAKVPPGAGPRHMAFSADGKFAFVDSEMGLSVTAFSRDAATGALTSIETVPTLPPETPRQGASGAEIAIHPSSKWLYVSNRGRDTITVFHIAADGRLAFIQEAPAGVKTPRGFAIDPTGNWLVAAGQDDDRIAVLKIDSATGKLSGTDQSATLGSPVCVIFAPLE